MACNLKAISAGSVQGRSAVNDGYVYTLEGKAITLPQVAEWMSLERCCCSFLTLQVSAAGTQSDWLLTLTGLTGTKVLLEMQFPAH